MNNKLVVVADLGSFKAYKLETSSLHSTPRLELLEEFNLIDAHGKMLGRVTDLAGRDHVPTGERHNIELERKRRLVKQLAHSLNDLLRRDDSAGCYLAASKEISHQIIDELPREARAKIEKIVPSDLTKADKSDLLRHFDIVKSKFNETPFLANREQMRRSGNLRQQL